MTTTLDLITHLIDHASAIISAIGTAVGGVVIAVQKHRHPPRRGRPSGLTRRKGHPKEAPVKGDAAERARERTRS